MDPFAALEEECRKQEAETKAESAMVVARSRLVLGRDAAWAFFAQLALRLRVERDWSIDTCATDGKSLIYNPDFVASLPTQELVAVLAHEVAHVVLCHHARRGDRLPGVFNEACDLAINPLLTESGFKLPACRIMPGEGQYAGLEVGLNAEDYYQRLRQRRGQEEGQEVGGLGDQEGNSPPGCGNDPGRCGAVKDPGDGSDSACRQAEAEAREKVAQARTVSKQRGTMPAGLERLVGELLEPKTDWRTILREFLTRQARNDYSWRVPNKRFIHAGIYLPGLRSEELGDVVVAVDTSGSIGEDMLRVFGGELNGILESYGDVKVTVIYHDAAVAHVQEWSSSDGPLVLEPHGGGGTDHRPVFKWVEEADVNLACMVCLTDMASCFPDEAPLYPVLWASVGGPRRAPFGTLIEVTLD